MGSKQISAFELVGVAHMLQQLHLTTLLLSVFSFVSFYHAYTMSLGKAPQKPLGPLDPLYYILIVNPSKSCPDHNQNAAQCSTRGGHGLAFVIHKDPNARNAFGDGRRHNHYLRITPLHESIGRCSIDRFSLLLGVIDEMRSRRSYAHMLYLACECTRAGGNGLGYKGIKNSLVLELDSWFLFNTMHACLLHTPLSLCALFPSPPFPVGIGFVAAAIGMWCA